MNQESLKANDDDETVESARESGIFADLAVRQPVEVPRAEGRSIPPPPPTRSSILPVARKSHEDEGLELEDFVAPETDEVPDFEDDDIMPVRLPGPSTTIRPEAAAPSRTLPPPPPRQSSPSLPGMSIPQQRSTSIAPGTMPVSAMVANAALTLPSSQPVERDMSGTYQKVDAQRTSYAAALQGPMAMPAAQVALDHEGSPYGTGPSAPVSSSQLPYAVLAVAVLIAGCFGWYMFSARTVPGVVQVTTAPADAEVLFDGMALGSVSPFLKTGVVPGEKHKLEVKKPGFKTWAQEVEVQSGQTLSFTVALPSEGGATAPSAPVVTAPVQAAPAVQALEVAPEPVAAAAIEPAQPAPAAEKVMAAAPAVEARARPKAVTAPSAARPAKAAASSATGTLRVSARPWAIVTIDGKLIGNTPQMNLTLPEGSHRVELSNPEFKIDKVMTVKIEAGKIETLIVNLL